MHLKERLERISKSAKREAFAYGCSDAMNRKPYADTLDCKTHLRKFRLMYDKGWYSTRHMLQRVNHENQ